jgi:hypothetical protein
VLTAADVSGLLAAGPVVLAVHSSVTLTHAAQERLRGAGVRIIPAADGPVPGTAATPPPGAAPLPAPPEAPAGADGAEAALFQQVKAAVLARLDRPVEAALLDAVLKRVLAEI